MWLWRDWHRLSHTNIYRTSLFVLKLEESLNRITGLNWKTSLCLMYFEIKISIFEMIHFGVTMYLTWLILQMSTFKCLIKMQLNDVRQKQTRLELMSVIIFLLAWFYNCLPNKSETSKKTTSSIFSYLFKDAWSF